MAITTTDHKAVSLWFDYYIYYDLFIIYHLLNNPRFYAFMWNLNICYYALHSNSPLDPQYSIFSPFQMASTMASFIYCFSLSPWMTRLVIHLHTFVGSLLRRCWIDDVFMKYVTAHFIYFVSVCLCLKVCQHIA